MIEWVVEHPGVFVIGWPTLCVAICWFVHKVFDGRGG